MYLLLKLKKIFKLPVGLSDHTSGILAPVIATSLGAKIIEKHSYVADLETK